MTNIYSNFNKLAEEKKKRILNVAIQEFTKQGFDKASTNNIAKNAQISKGALFNYFNTKKDLFLYLIEYAAQIIEDLYNQIDLNETDLFKRIKNVGFQKLNTQQKFPFVFDFLTSLKQEDSAEVKDIITQNFEHIFKQGISKIYENIDYSKFREDIDIEKAIEILNWTMLGFSEKSIKQIETYENLKKVGDQYIKEWNIYAEILRKNFYK